MLVRSLPEPLGAEIIGLTGPALADPEIRRELRDALFEHLVLVLRNQDLGTRDQVRLTRMFGEPELAWDKRSRHPDEPHVQVMRSAPAPKDAPPSSSQHWHTDGSFLEKPPIATFLASIHLPQSGGDTLFVDTRSACESLPPARLATLEVLNLRFSYSYRLYGFQTTRYGSDDRAELEDHPDVVHPLVRKHPVTGRGSLYLDQLCVAKVESLAEDTGNAILSELYGHTLVAERCYKHEWRSGDVLIWDNPSLMHRRGESHQGDRLLHRTTAAGSRPIPLRRFSQTHD